MMFPEHREHHLLSSAPLLILTLIQEEQMVKGKQSKFKASPPSLSPATKHNCTQTFGSMEGTVPSRSHAALQHRWHMADRCPTDTPGSRNMIYSSLFSLLFPASLLYTNRLLEKRR